MLSADVAAPSRGQQLVQNQARIDELLLEQARLAAEFGRTDEWEQAGFSSPIDWLRFTCHVTSTVAANYCIVGQLLPRLRETERAMRSNEIGYAHVAVMARTADAIGDGFNETTLLPTARENTPGRFHYKCLHYRHSVDVRSYDEAQELLVEERKLRLNTAEDGCLLISGILDSLGGAALRGALEPLAQPSGAHDDRNREQRYADALVELASRGKPVNLQITATIETLKGLAGAAAGEMEFSLPISSTSVRRFACDCSVTRVLLDQESVTIDVGRSRRVISPGLRKALHARDGHCRWPDCERPASWCDGHHVVHWIHGGETNLGNLVLLCRRHHRMVHEGGWQLIKTKDGQVVTIAPTILFGLPRGPD